MENQRNDFDGNEAEEFPDEFQCSVCLDILYKPVVLACGHISCFWCVFKAMDTFQESRCPVCRHPYNHFPSICQLLHFLLLRKYPLVYKTREKQVIEEEKKWGSFSPQFDDCLSGSVASNGFDKLGGFSSHSTNNSNRNFQLQSCSTVKGEPSAIMDSSEAILPDKDYTALPLTSSCEATTSATLVENSINENKLGSGTCDQVLIADLLCAGCKKLLCRPLVLNCGHVYCEACVINPSDKGYRCQVCQSVHPNGLPKVCLVLEHFLEEHFAEEHAARKEALLKQAACLRRSPSTNSTQAQQHAAKESKIQSSYYSSWLSGQGPKVHFEVGCDFCGMYPIIGERYKCEDCVEEIGFDLCEECYNSSSKLPGRFNQQHRPEHKFKIVQTPFMDSLVMRIDAELSGEYESDDSAGDIGVSQVPFLSGDTPPGPEHDSVAAISSNNTSEQQHCTDSTNESDA